MTTMPGRADWRADGACAQRDPDLFFPISSTGPALEQIAKAKAICRGCPVQRPCLDFALEHDLGYGIWGGTTPQDRQAWRRRRRSEQVRTVTLLAGICPSRPRALRLFTVCAAPRT
jgi:WhiB family transcriptional regulator, redox-sensing transcriptional regulator